MNKLTICLLAALASSAMPVLAQEAAALATSPVIIAPPQSAMAQTIKSELSGAYYGAAKDSAAYIEAQRLYFFYGSRHFEPIWLDTAADGEVSFSARADAIISLFKNAEAEGLRPSDYLSPALDPAVAKNDASKLAELETAFSAATLRYASHLYNGRIKPQSIDKNLDIAAKPFDPTALLIQLGSSDNPAAMLAELNPKHPEFLALKQALANFDDAAQDRPEQIAQGPTLRPGMSDDRVPALRNRLGLVASETLTYDAALVDAMKAFQKSQELDVDGVMGPATLAAINGGLPVTRADIIANMERWRWAPQDLGDFHVFVNIPEFRLSINRGDTETYTTRVVVGTVKNQTPVFSDNIRHVVVNPYWNVPSSIIKGEIAPAVLRNPAYTDNHNMDLIYNGAPVSPWQVDWTQVSANKFPFRVRQRPGPGNSLGQIKFLFPNKHDVYLHDTPSKSLFSRSFRAYSHGCVRVQDPMAFADALMANEPKISRTSLEAMFGPNERWVNPEKQIPVHLVYFTVRPAADGSLKSFGDVYGHHTKLIEALGLKQNPIAKEIIAEAIPEADPLSP
jgi:murein L,D-transpeptidase YcbB/YkuD